jgi:type IV pilus assembly protein PilY1
MTSGQLDSNLPRLKSQLEQRSMTRQSSGTAYITGAAIDWSTKKGWYIQFPGTSEMSLANPSIVQTFLAVVSVVPNSPSSDSCFGLPDAYITFVDPINGLLDQTVLGTTTVSGTTYNLASTKLDDQRVTVVRVRLSTTPSGKQQAGAVGATSFKLFTFDDRSSRVFWREIPTFKTQ